MKRFIVFLALFALALPLLGCLGSSEISKDEIAEIVSNGQAIPGKSAMNFRSLESREVVKTLHDNGFTNIWLKPLKDLSRNETDRIGLVADVTIDGSHDFGPKDVFENDVEVIVYWHCTYRNKNPRSVHVDDVDSYIDPWIPLDSGTTQSTPEVPAQTEQPVRSQPEQFQTTYILNTNTGVFHEPYCSSVGQMSDSNKQEFTGTRDEVISMGYKPCGRCHP